jgi:ATP-dependent Clp protease ATP-binding subunit ClpA
MFERFTGRARHVVVLAQEEARLLNHNYIGTEHVLLGLLGEPESVGGTVLTSFGMTRDGVRAEVEEAVGTGKKMPTGHIPFTPRAKKTLELSLREALAIKHNYIGTEHILLGLIREGEGVAAQIMRKHADLADIRAAVLTAVSAFDPGEPAEGTEETNAVLRWLRQRLSGRQASAPAAFSPEAQAAALAAHGTPAVEAALKQAAALAGQAPVGSHHLLLAALTDANSAASWALASLGVDIDELREKLRSARITGTSDEQPEQAGRRQMSIDVSDEKLTLTLTDSNIVEAGKEALRVVNARAAAVAAAKAVAEVSTGEGSTGEEAEEPSGAASGGPRVEGTVIRGDLPEATGLADVWLELRKTLAAIINPEPQGRRVAVAVQPPGSTEAAEPAADGESDDPEAPEAASS